MSVNRPASGMAGFSSSNDARSVLSLSRTNSHPRSGKRAAGSPRLTSYLFSNAQGKNQPPLLRTLIRCLMVMGPPLDGVKSAAVMCFVRAGCSGK